MLRHFQEPKIDHTCKSFKCRIETPDDQRRFHTNGQITVCLKTIVFAFIENE